jgi:hypothetical protein
VAIALRVILRRNTGWPGPNGQHSLTSVTHQLKIKIKGRTLVPTDTGRSHAQPQLFLPISLPALILARLSPCPPISLLVPFLARPPPCQKMPSLQQADVAFLARFSLRPSSISIVLDCGHCSSAIPLLICRSDLNGNAGKPMAKVRGVTFCNKFNTVGAEQR